MSYNKNSVRLIMGGLLVLTVALLVLNGCEFATPKPTPTPTRTPILPTATPTLTPSLTPTPTPTLTPTPTPTLTPSPTLPPGLVLPATPVKPTGWPTLPTDLYFLREGQLWTWLAEGGKITGVPIVKEGLTDNVLDYRITPDQQSIIYATTMGKFYIFSRAQWQHTFIPTAGRLLNEGKPSFDITADGKYLVYAAWGVRPTVGERPRGEAVYRPVGDTYATLLALELAYPRRRQIELGVCEGTSQQPCANFILSPDSSQVIYADGNGLWQTDFAGTAPRLLRAPEAAGPTWYPQTISESGQHLLLHTVDVTGRQYALMSLQTGEMWEINDIACPTCRVEAVFEHNVVWMSRDSAEEGCLLRIEPGGADFPIQYTYQLCRSDTWPLHPTSPQVLPDGWVAFLHRGCGADCPGPAPGLYFLGPDEQLHTIALLPEAEGSALWLNDGAAFLYLNQDSAPHYLGVASTLGFWDVSTSLAGASAFKWGLPSP